MRRTRGLVVWLSAALAVVSASCGSDDGNTAQTTGASMRTETDGASGEITVFAASSLTAALTEIGDVFMGQHPDTKVTFNFASSSDLVTQINDGAPADI